MVNQQKKILAINVHPNLNGLHTKGDNAPSLANKIIMEIFDSYQNITTHSLISVYPDLNIDVLAEQKLLNEHDIILLVGPIYWYALPALAKHWIDEVLLYNWAYGTNGNALKDKCIQLVLTSGSIKDEYTPDQIGNTLEELFVPYQRSFEYCKLKYLPIKFLGGINTEAKQNRIENLTLKIKEFAKSIATQF